jgi:hypothetical protein
MFRYRRDGFDVRSRRKLDNMTETSQNSRKLTISLASILSLEWRRVTRDVTVARDDLRCEKVG